jgi:hypothetical protein
LQCRKEAVLVFTPSSHEQEKEAAGVHSFQPRTGRRSDPITNRKKRK